MSRIARENLVNCDDAAIYHNSNNNNNNNNNNNEYLYRIAPSVQEHCYQRGPVIIT